eukprot:1138394-Pleurochrysis_carterae.AAC.1
MRDSPASRARPQPSFAGKPASSRPHANVFGTCVAQSSCPSTSLRAPPRLSTFRTFGPPCQCGRMHAC